MNIAPKRNAATFSFKQSLFKPSLKPDRVSLKLLNVEAFKCIQSKKW